MASGSAYDTFLTKALAVIQRATGEDSVYTEQARYVIDSRNAQGRTDWSRITGALVGILETTKTAIGDGYLDTVSDVIHGTVFAVFLGWSSTCSTMGIRMRRRSSLVARSNLT